LEFRDADGWCEIGRGTTDADGRVSALVPGGLPKAGDYRLRFVVGDYFQRCGQPVFYPEVVIHVRIDEAATAGRFHLPLLLNPFGYTTYRGS
jgi:5-hydroxyisourate hydrolase